MFAHFKNWLYEITKGKRETSQKFDKVMAANFLDCEQPFGYIGCPYYATKIIVPEDETNKYLYVLAGVLKIGTMDELKTDRGIT